MLLPALVLVIVLAPVLLPVIITAVHVLTGRARSSTQDRAAANFARRTGSPRLAVPNAA
jgi:ABC-type transport system involved in cytochrome c biogenesis permease component